MLKGFRQNFSKQLGTLIFLAALAFFIGVIFLPAVYVLSFVAKARDIFTPEIINAVAASFIISLIVTFIDLIFGLPLAWIITRSKSKFIKLFDSLIDLSLVIPTAALGFSVYLYWGSKYGLAYLLGLDTGLLSKGPLLIILLHVVFTLPYMIRSIGAAISKIDLSYEQAAITLGANPFTIFRTIFLPLFKDGIIVGSILSFTRSLSETGATMMVAGVFVSAPVLIVSLKQSGQIPLAAGASIIMILSAVIILFLSKLLLGQKAITLEKVYPRLEKSLLKFKSLRNWILAVFFIFIIFLPTIYLLIFNLANFKILLSSLLLKSILISFALALAATFINIFFAAPIAYYISRNKFRLGFFLDSLNDVVLLVPTSALGLSLVLFWRNFISQEYLILLLTHLSFTFPLLVKPLTMAFKNIPATLEDAACTLGASKSRVFISILVPLIKPALIAGAIMAFMRSLSETGATLAVSDKIKTIPILIVDLVNQNNLNEAGFVAAVLFVIALTFLFILKTNKFSKE
ncbi:MAG: ABC transporter permease subunit [Candidatus Parcubacteria bacterium]|nr:ABC transporter permease subunit [Candidatus Parcubacteria bacterium]